MFHKISTTCLVALLLITTVAAETELNYKSDELLIRFAPKTDGRLMTRSEKQTLLSTLNSGTVKHEYKIVQGLSLVKLPDGLSVKEAIYFLKTRKDILYVEPNYKLKLFSTFPNDTRFDELWGMHNTDQTGGSADADIDAPEAWDIITDSNIIVAVIDSGIDYTHPDLEYNIWINQVEVNGTPGVDDDDNGYIDDIRGWDFDANDNDPIDLLFHGTHVAGTIGAVGNNSEGVTGICWNVKLMAINISNYDDDPWTVFASNAVKGIDYAVENGAKVLNASWGGSTPIQALEDAIEVADACGVLFIAAAGNDYSNNDSYPMYPAYYDCDNIISVLATDHDDYKVDFSNYGVTSVDLGAPGSNILSTFPTYMTGAMYGYGLSTDYETISGTSMAAPHVAGACALVWGMNPALSHLEVKDIIMETVDETVPPLECVSQGRLNLYNAIVEAGTQAGKQAVILSKVDDVNGPVLPGDHITYTISFENTVRGPNDANFPFGDLTSVKIVDHLPAEVDCNNPFDPNYNSNDHTYTWNIGTLMEDDSDSVELTVVVNNLAEPLGKITNVCVIDANEIWPKTAIETTDVNCWNPGIIYVDMDAVAVDNTGMSWEHAYTDLQDTLEKVCNCYANEIWVAEGTYKPTNSDRLISFELVDNVAIYGGFAGTESHPSQRNLTDPNNETVLSGDIAAPNDHTDNSYHVVKCENVYNAILDGFTITAGNADAPGSADPNRCGGGIYGTYSLSSTITNCTFSDNSAKYAFAKTISAPGS